jgi:hypothetical protein
MIEIVALLLMAYQGWRALNRLKKVFAPPPPPPADGGTGLLQLLMHSDDDRSEDGGDATVSSVSSMTAESVNSDMFLLDAVDSDPEPIDEEAGEPAPKLRRVVSRRRHLQHDAADILGLGREPAAMQVIDQEEVDDEGVVVIISGAAPAVVDSPPPSPAATAITVRPSVSPDGAAAEEPDSGHMSASSNVTASGSVDAGGCCADAIAVELDELLGQVGSCAGPGP